MDIRKLGQGIGKKDYCKDATCHGVKDINIFKYELKTGIFSLNTIFHGQLNSKLLVVDFIT